MCKYRDQKFVGNTLLNDFVSAAGTTVHMLKAAFQGLLTGLDKSVL